MVALFMKGGMNEHMPTGMCLLQESLNRICTAHNETEKLLKAEELVIVGLEK